MFFESESPGLIYRIFHSFVIRSTNSEKERCDGILCSLVVREYNEKDGFLEKNIIVGELKKIISLK